MVKVPSGFTMIVNIVHQGASGPEATPLKFHVPTAPDEIGVAEGFTLLEEAEGGLVPIELVAVTVKA